MHSIIKENITNHKENCLSESLEGIGVTGKSKDTAISYDNFSQKCHSSSTRIIRGATVKLFCDLITDINIIRSELLSEVDTEREKILREDKLGLIKLALDSYDKVNKAELSDTVVKLKKHELKKTENRSEFIPEIH
jgi:hypothetical protein